MGYDTSFHGEFNPDKPLTQDQIAYLEAFSRTRRMSRDATQTEALPDPLRLAVGLPVGPQGAYYVGDHGDDLGQTHAPEIINYNVPPQGQPGLWCQWVPDETGEAILWDGVEKFYEYVAWLEYLIEHFLKPWGYTLNGEVSWQGEDSDDRGTIYVKDNMVRAVNDVIEKGKPVW